MVNTYTMEQIDYLYDHKVMLNNEQNDKFWKVNDMAIKNKQMRLEGVTPQEVEKDIKDKMAGVEEIIMKMEEKKRALHKDKKQW